MTRFFILLSFFLLSCNSQLEKYERIVGEANAIDIHYKGSGKTMRLSSEQVVTFKEILMRSIKPELQRKFISDIQIDLLKNNKRLGFLRLTEGGQSPFVNFESDELNFGFRLTYGIGRFIEEIK